MISDSKEMNFDVVIVWKIDRFSRDKYDSVYYKNILKKNGVSVLSATEPIDDSPEGQLMESIFEGFSAYYLKDLSMKVNRGMTENVLKGKFNGGNITFGYYVDENRQLQPDPERALIVADIFKRYAGGEGTKDILNDLLKQGVMNTQGKAPTYSFIINMLKNRRYLGEYKFNDTVVENAFLPLVDVEIFNICQRRIESNKQKPAHFKTVEDKYILTGKVYCGLCGSSMNGVSGTSSTGTKHRYYRCHSAQKYKSCDMKRVSKNFVESAVLSYTMQVLNDEEIVDKIATACYELQSQESAALPVLEKQLKQTQKEIDNVMNAIKQGIITATTKETLLELEQEKENLEISIAKERIEKPVISKEHIKFWISKFSNTDLDNVKQKQKLIDAFLNSIYVYEDKMLIILNYKDGEIATTFDEITEILAQKENPDNQTNYQSSPLKVFGDPPATRTRDPLLKRQMLYRLS